MRGELIKLLDEGIGDLLRDPSKWDTLLIDKYPPVIHRLYTKLSDDRTLILHRLFHSGEESCLMHSHSWDFAIKIIEGGYEMGVGFSDDRDSPPETTFQTHVHEGDVYEMTSENVWHYTRPIENKESYSVMLIGPRKRERNAENNLPLTDDQKMEVLNYFANKLKPKEYKEKNFLSIIRGSTEFYELISLPGWINQKGEAVTKDIILDKKSALKIRVFKESYSILLTSGYWFELQR